jgi:methionine-rich copper-binding protein CopC
MRTTGHVMALVLAVLMGASVVAAPAAAHTDLVSSTLADGTWTSGDGLARIDFSTPLLPEGTQVVVDVGAGARTVPARTVASHLLVELADLPAGRAHLRFAVVGVDGHRISDEIAFRVGPGTAPARPGAGEGTAPAEGTDVRETSDSRTRVVVGCMVAALLAAVALSAVNAGVMSRGRA